MPHGSRNAPQGRVAVTQHALERIRNMPARIATPGTKIVVVNTIVLHAGAKPFIRTLDPEQYDRVSIESAMSNVLHDKPMSREMENKLRSALGAEPLPGVELVQVCPIHGVVHDTECDGEQGAAVWVHPKEKLVKAPGFGRTRKWRFMVELTDESTVAALRNFKEYIGGDWNETVRAALYLAMGGKSDDLYR